MNQGTYTDIRLDTFDTIDGVNYLWLASAPHKRYEVVTLLDHSGDETDDVEFAAGGVVKINDQSFMTFTF